MAVNSITHMSEPYLVTLGRLLSLDEFLAMPKEEGYKYELIDGRVIRAATTQWHGRLTSRLLAAIQTYAEAHDLGECTTEDTGYDFAPHARRGHLRSPDVGFIRKERLLPLSDRSLPFFKEAPDLVVEVVSEESQDIAHMQERATFWLNHGARLVWVIWPDECLVNIWEPERPVRSIGLTGNLDGQDVLPGFQYPLTRLFRER